MIKIDWKTCFKVGVSIFLLYLCIHYWSLVSDLLFGIVGAASPLILGAALAFVVNVLMSFYERHYFPRSKKSACIRSRRPVCLIFAYLSLIFVVVLVLWLVIPQLVSCVQLMISKLPAAIRTAIETMQGWEFMPDDLLAALASIDWAARINQLISLVGNGVGDMLNVVINTVTSVFSGVFTAVLGIIFSVYLLSEKEKLARQCMRLMDRYFNEKWTARLLYLFRTLNKNFRGYIVGQTTEALILGALVTLGMFILGLPYATMIGALVAVMALIPIAGAYISGGIGALMMLSERPINAVIFVVFLVLLQQVEGNLIYPRVVGSTIGLPPIWVLAAVVLGGGLFGIAGMIFAVPLFATAYTLLKNDLNFRAAQDIVVPEQAEQSEEACE